MKFSNIKIGQKIMIVAAVPMLLFLLVSGVAIYSIFQMATASDKVDRATNRLTLSTTAEMDALIMQSSLHNFAASGNENALAGYNDRREKIFDALKAVSAAASKTPAQVAQVDAAVKALKTWEETIADKVIELKRQTTESSADITNLLDTGTAQFADFGNAIDAFRKFEQSSINDRAAISDATVLAAYWWVGAGNAIALTLGCLVALFIGAGIYKPLGQLAKVLGQLATGNTSVDIAGSTRKDEIGGIAKATLVFKENAIKVAMMTEEEAERLERSRTERAQMMQQLQQAFGEVVDAAVAGDFSKRVTAAFPDAELNTLSESVNNLVDTVDRGLSETGEVLAALADTNLTKRVEGQYHGAFAKLKDDTNAVNDKLVEIVGQLRGTSRALKSATGEILAGANDLSERTTKQAATIEETSATMEQLAATVLENAKRAEDASVKAKAVTKTAEDGGAVMAQANGAMERITQSSSKISNIIGMIDDIAFQTNLLALNASVEAARAGDAGKGFAVVAVEVRRLAQSAASASSEVKALIEQSANEVQGGSKLVAEAATKLSSMLTAVLENNVALESIARASREQASSIEEVNTAVRQMDEMTQHNAALVEETNAAIEQTEAQASELDNVVDVFRVTDNSLSSKSRSMGREKPVGTPAAKPQMRSAGSARSYLSQGNAAIDKDWSEF